jgi:hypothetical protein
MQATVNVLGAKLETSRFETLRHLRHAETKSSLSELLVTGKAFFAVTLLKNLFVIAHVTMVTTTKTAKTTTMTMTTVTFMNNEPVNAKFQKQPNGKKRVMLK